MTLRFGMIGASRISVEALIAPASRSAGVRVQRVAARRPGAAREYAERWGIPAASDDYGDVISDGALDAVYISHAAADHAQWSVAALRSGKHVLCEKPIAVNAAEAAEVARAAADAGRVVMEGFHYRFHPLFRHLVGLVRSGRFGALVSVDSVVAGVREFDAGSVLHAADAGGGALLHNGVYPVHWTRTLMDGEPVAVTGRHRLNPSGADSETRAELTFTGGRSASLMCSFDTDAPVQATVRLEGAEVVATGLIVPHHGHSVRVSVPGEMVRTYTVAGGSSFDDQLRMFVSRILTTTTPPVPTPTTPPVPDDVIAQAQVIDAITHSAATHPSL